MTVAGEAWPEVRKFGGSPTLVEEEEGLAWWWRDVGTVVERERDDWPEQRGWRRDATTAAQRWQHNKGARVVVSPEVVEREIGDNDSGNTTVAA